MLARAEAADQADVPDGMSIPEELALREKRLAKLAEARARIEARGRPKGRCRRTRSISPTKTRASCRRRGAASNRAGLEPLIAMGRQPHHPPLCQQFGKEIVRAAMAHRLKTPEGRALYALRKQTPEPVFGIIKSALGFRQFSLRGLDKVRGEWSLVTMAWNLKRMFVLAPA